MAHMTRAATALATTASSPAPRLAATTTTTAATPRHFCGAPPAARGGAASSSSSGSAFGARSATAARGLAARPLRALPKRRDETLEVLESMGKRYDFVSSGLGALAVTGFFVARGQDPLHALAITVSSTLMALVLNELLNDVEQKKGSNP